MNVIIDKSTPQFKANLHCHSNLSDGRLSPEELKDAYKANGYSVLAITDHERPRCHSDLTEKDFLMLTGYEAYFRASEYAICDPFDSELHVNLIATTPDNTAYVNYDPKYDKYTNDEAEKAAYIRVGEQGKREYTVEYINKFLKHASENGYICTYNHPVWSLEDASRILKYEGLFSIEMCNYGSICLGLPEYNGALYDSLLRAGSRLYCHSSDDNHNKFPLDHPSSDSFGGFTMILAKELSYEPIIEALKSGEFYSSMGPLIYEITKEENKVTVKTSPAKRITAIFGGKRTAFTAGTCESPVSELSFEIPRGAKYFRINVRDFEGKFADTHAYDV